MKIILGLLIGLSCYYIAAKLHISAQKDIMKQALEEHEKEKANDKSRE